MHVRHRVLAALVPLLALAHSGSASQAYTFHLLHSFSGGADGANPQSTVIRDRSGNLYGTTGVGGAYQYGTVFKVAKDGSKTVLHSFSGRSDGGSPAAGMIFDEVGNLYGTGTYGGASDKGVVFKLAPDGTLTVLHSFSGNDGAYPYGGLVRDETGIFYGTASGGGSHDGGVAYTLASDGTFGVLHNFGGTKDASTPLATLTIDGQRNLYGAAPGGGAYGYGAIFKLRPNGHERILYWFSGGQDGSEPYAGVIRDALGNLYGTTFAGGAHGDGVAYKLAPHGRLIVLHAFEEDEGEYLYAGLVADKSGNLYGATVHGGAAGGGVIFKLAADGKETVLHSFGYGAGPYASPTLDGHGNLYGTTFRGSADQGSVWQITP